MYFMRIIFSKFVFPLSGAAATIQGQCINFFNFSEPLFIGNLILKLQIIEV